MRWIVLSSLVVLIVATLGGARAEGVSVSGASVSAAAPLGSHTDWIGPRGRLPEGVPSTATRKLVVSLAGAGRGRVTSRPHGIDCPRTCSARFRKGTPVRLFARARAGSAFVRWGGACRGVARCDPAIRTDRAVSASFRVKHDSSDVPSAGPLPPAPAAEDARLITPVDAKTLASGVYHACAIIRATGVVRCWGGNSWGQLGSGSRKDLLLQPGEEPSTLSLGARAVSLAAGFYHTCALLENGVVRCWGNDEHGQAGAAIDSTGNGSLMDGPGEAASVVPLGDKAVAIAAGGWHSCALLETGVVRCWGRGELGQTGAGSTNDLLDQRGEEASVVPLGGKAVSLVSGYAHNCALLESGTMRCWGLNVFGQLGAGSTENLLDQPGETPSTVLLGTKIVAMTAGNNHTCAALATGVVRCWGYGPNGELGSGLTVNLMDQPSEQASVIQFPEKAVSVSASGYSTCAVLENGVVRCWGLGEFAQLGSGSTENLMDQPGEDASIVPLGGKAVMVAAGGAFCALLDTGVVRCWGAGNGALGSGSSEALTDQPNETPSTVPVGGRV